MSMALQQYAIQKQSVRMSREQKELKGLDAVYSPMLRQTLSKPAHAPNMEGFRFGQQHAQRLALQTCRINLLKKDQGGDADHADEPLEVSGAPTEEPEAILVPLPLILQGPAAVAWKLRTDAQSTEEQIDAVALLALSLQKVF